MYTEDISDAFQKLSTSLQTELDIKYLVESIKNTNKKQWNLAIRDAVEVLSNLTVASNSNTGFDKKRVPIIVTENV